MLFFLIPVPSEFKIGKGISLKEVNKLQMKLLREGWGNIYGTCCTFSLSKKMVSKMA